MLFHRLKRFLEFYKLHPSIRATIALSGGPDSTALAALVSRWRADVGNLSFRTHSLLYQKDPLINLKSFGSDALRPLAVVVDHGLRPESQDEAIFVGKQAEALGLEVHITAIDWGRSKPDKRKAMAAARQKRYELLYNACLTANSAVLLTGHHAGDQMETFVSRFFGASGVDGLSGMQPASLIRPGCPGPLFHTQSMIDHPILLLRPLLGVSKCELVQYCEEHSLSFVTDPTNTDSCFARARVRNVLESEPGVARDIAAVQRLCKHARELQEIMAFALLRAAWVRNEGSLSSGGSAIFDVGAFVGSTPWVVQRLILVVLQVIAHKEHPPRSGISSLVDALQSGKLERNFDFGGCLIQPVAQSKGSRMMIRKSFGKNMVDGS